MNTFELYNILQRNISPQEIFLGVFALDGLPTRSELHQRNRWFLVCNCCPSTKRGHHWVAVFYNHGSVEFFDSFALPPLAYDERMMRFLHHTSGAHEILFNDVRLQQIDSDACGHYCILFGVARSGGDTFQKIVKELSSLTRDNLVKFIVKTVL